MTKDPTYGEKSGQDPHYGPGGEGEDPQDEQVDTGMPNEDLHGQAREVAESAQTPGPGETPAG